jgi:phosphoribosylaminoimidazole carboxylase (NCAIR synthetase)
MKSEFPVVGVIGAGEFSRMMIAPATALGVKLLPFAASETDSAAQITPCVVGEYTDIEAVKKFAEQCDVVTFEDQQVPLHVIKALEATGVRVRPSSQTLKHSRELSLTQGLTNFDYKISVMVARSPHSQATSWAPTQLIESEGICTLTITPAPLMSAQLRERAQKIALDTASDIKLIGVMAVEMLVKGDEIFLTNIAIQPHNSGNWSIEGSCTSQFEQHLRAVLDLPLGDPSMPDNFAVTGNIVGKSKTDMYRPYLHLMARSPSLKFHLYGKRVTPGLKIGHVNIVGKDFAELQIEIEHALDYMSGEIDE